MENLPPSVQQVDKTKTSAISTGTASRDDYWSLLDTERQSLKSFYFIWLDSNIAGNHDIETAIEILKRNVTFVLLGKDWDEYQLFMECFLNHEVVLIVSYECAKQIMSDIYHLTSIIAIYTYCLDYKVNSEWTRNYWKIRKVIFNMNELARQILKDLLNFNGMEKLTYQHSSEPDMESNMREEMNLEAIVQPGIK